MNEVYYKCPVCGRESEDTGECAHGLARVSMQKTHVISNPINSIPMNEYNIYGRECTEIFKRNAITIGSYKAINQCIKVDEE